MQSKQIINSKSQIGILNIKIIAKKLLLYCHIYLIVYFYIIR